MMKVLGPALEPFNRSYAFREMIVLLLVHRFLNERTLKKWSHFTGPMRSEEINQSPSIPVNLGSGLRDHAMNI
jgi:hypothetical protein